MINLETQYRTCAVDKFSATTFLVKIALRN